MLLLIFRLFCFCFFFFFFSSRRRHTRFDCDWSSDVCSSDLAAQRIAQELLVRVQALTGLGLGYLSLDRATPTLSPGELQRLRLATQLASQLFGVVYVLDEPTAGLHPAATPSYPRTPPKKRDSHSPASRRSV